MPNTLQAAIPKILAGGLAILRKRTVMPSLIRTDFSNEAAQKGDTIDLRDLETPDVRDVSPSNTPPSTGDTELEKVSITLDNWKEAPFYMDDKDLMEAVDGVVPDQVEKAAKKLAEQINKDIFSTYYRVYNHVGSAGSTPFSTDYSDASAARKTMNNNEVPISDRRLVIDPDAEENAINLSSFADASFADDDSVITDGQIGRKVGFDFVMDQQVPSHTAGSLTGDPTVSGSHTAGIGAKSITIATDSGDAVSLNQGDIVTFAGDTQTYAATADLSLGASASGELKIEPGLQVDLSGGEALSLDEGSDHVVNLAFHRDAFGLAVRPLADVVEDEIAVVRTMTDPLTGIPLRLEVKREHKRTQWSFDVLYGTQSIDPRLAVRLKG